MPPTCSRSSLRRSAWRGWRRDERPTAGFRPSNWKRFPMTVASTTKERLGGAVVFFVPDERTLPPREGYSVDRYLESAGGSALAKVLSLPRTEISEVVAQAGLRGRGGAGFPIVDHGFGARCGRRAAPRRRDCWRRPLASGETSPAAS